MPAIYDRVKETSATTGTGVFTLAGASIGYRSFQSTIGTGNPTYYCIERPGSAEWEIGVGTLTTSTTLTRTTVLKSSNSDSAVDFGAGTKNVFLPLPAEVIVYTAGSYANPSWITSLAASKLTGVLVISAPTATDIPAVFRGAESQSANLTEWQNNEETVLGHVSPAGNLYMAGNIDAGQDQTIGWTTIGRARLWSGTANSIEIRGASGNPQVAIGQTGGVGFGVNATGVLEINTGAYNGAGDLRDLMLRNILAYSASTVPVTVKGATSQTANLTEWKNADNDVLAQVHASGVFKIDAHYGDITAVADGATINFDMDQSNKHTVTLGGNRTLTVSNDDIGQNFIIILKQDVAGNRTVNWWGGILWPNGTTPTLTTTGEKTDVFSFLKTDSGVYFGFIVGQNL